MDQVLDVIEQYENVEAQFQLLLKLNTGVISSRVVGGFQIPSAAVFDDDENLAVLKQLLSA